MPFGHRFLFLTFRGAEAAEAAEAVEEAVAVAEAVEAEAVEAEAVAEAEAEAVVAEAEVVEAEAEAEEVEAVAEVAVAVVAEVVVAEVVEVAVVEVAEAEAAEAEAVAVAVAAAEAEAVVAEAEEAEAAEAEAATQQLDDVAAPVHGREACDRLRPGGSKSSRMMSLFELFPVGFEPTGPYATTIVAQAVAGTVQENVIVVPDFVPRTVDVAALGALDHDIRLGRAVQVRIGDTHDRAGDRVPDLHLPLRPIQRLAGLRQSARRPVEAPRPDAVRRLMLLPARAAAPRARCPPQQATTSALGLHVCARATRLRRPPHAAVPPLPRLPSPNGL